MPTQTWHPEWLDSHEGTNYPFSDSATLVNAAGARIEKGLFLDASLYIIGASERCYLSKIVVTNTAVTVFIGDNNTTELASTTFSTVAVPATLRLTDQYSRPAGILVSEPIRLVQLKALGTGTHVFTASQTEFVAAVCAPLPEVGVKGILLDDGSLVANDVWIVGDDGVVVTYEDVPVAQGCVAPAFTEKAIRVDVVGDPLYRRRLCPAPSMFQTPQFLENLCFVTPELRGTTSSSTSSDYSLGADILLLADLTGSMAALLATVKSVLPSVLQTVEATLPDSPIRWAVAGYRDYEDGPEFSEGFALYQAFTEDTDAVIAAVQANYNAIGGGDTPEQNLAALHNFAGQWVLHGGRTAAPRAIVWAGDEPGWEADAKGNDYPTLTETINRLKTQSITVFGLNTRPAGYGIDSVGPPPADGRNQASAIAAETNGGMYNSLQAADANAVSRALIDAIISVSSGVISQPGVPAQYLCCGPGAHGDIKISVGSQDAVDTILRVRPAPEGLIIEAVGEKLEDIR